MPSGYNAFAIFKIISLDEFLATVEGKASKEEAKMTGMTPVALTLNGKYACLPRSFD